MAKYSGGNVSNTAGCNDGLQLVGAHSKTEDRQVFIKIYGQTSEAYTDVSVIVQKVTD